MSSFNSFGKGELRSNSAIATTGLSSSNNNGSSSSCRDSFVPIRKKPGSSSSSRRAPKLANLSSFSTTALLDKSPPMGSNNNTIHHDFPSNQQQQQPRTTINVTSPNNDTNVNINDLGFIPVSTRNINTQNNSKSNSGFLSNNTSSSSANTPSASTESSPRSSHITLPDISVGRSNKSQNERERKHNLLMKEDQEFIERLKQKVMDQQAEIEKSNGSLEQIQRNFEQLSSMYRSKYL
ncbi:predicted protein [Naegleria gruberi]|uniref:Predicted protein n=1 Tax=Naegleria gruberi TaxID=5762 RepID=D2VEM4_NAEGR|nr:uncharacterized protein NAEGRDRAFT_48925 [Naegleria gruberi]EFC44912.1 predicted protein [Naegleria gruberi]|eukprot:XP_002677656.1 predicted protein [Naegleria gruberi strain NEG-M]